MIKNNELSRSARRQTVQLSAPTGDFDKSVDYALAVYVNKRPVKIYKAFYIVTTVFASSTNTLALGISGAAEGLAAAASNSLANNTALNAIVDLTLAVTTGYSLPANTPLLLTTVKTSSPTGRYKLILELEVDETDEV